MWSQSTVAPERFLESGVCVNVEPHVSRAPGASLAAYPTPRAPLEPTGALCRSAHRIVAREGAERSLAREARSAAGRSVTVAIAPHVAPEHASGRDRIGARRRRGVKARIGSGRSR